MAGSLTRISIWSKGHGWQPTNASIVARTYKYGIESYSKMFLCELCNQYVTFVYSEIYNPYFKHPKGSDDCEEKTTSVDPYLTENPLGFSLPIKVKIENGHLEIFIGFLPIGETELEKIANENAKLSICVSNKIIKAYNIDHSRFAPNEVSYLSVGSFIAERYKIDSGGMVEKTLWPPIIEGIYKNGSLFDKASGKKFPRNANVEVGKDYLLITKQNFYGNSHGDIEIRRVNFIDGYYFYIVKATSLSRSAANFFLAFGTRLTDIPTDLTQIYPFVLRAPHIILHESTKLWFHKTNGIVDTFPESEAKERNQSIFDVRGDVQKILSLSRFEERTSVLRFMMLRKDRVDFHNAINNSHSVTSSVHDSKGIEFHNGQYDKLPSERVLIITTEFDGFADVVAVGNGMLIQRYNLKNGEKTKIDVAYRQKYRIFQGLDCVHEIVFIKERKDQGIADEQLLCKLKSFNGRKIAIQHNFGVIASKLGEMPLSRLWVMKQIKHGQIDIGAKDYLLKI